MTFVSSVGRGSGRGRGTEEAGGVDEEKVGEVKRRDARHQETSGDATVQEFGPGEKAKKVRHFLHFEKFEREKRLQKILTLMSIVPSPCCLISLLSFM